MKHRISVGALIVRDNKVLMVNHKRANRYDFWVAPGGGVQGTESLEEAVIREAKEAISEHIVNVKFMERNDFKNNKIFPPMLHNELWKEIKLENRSPKFIGLRKMEFY